MDYRDIESFKYSLIKLLQKGCTLKIPAYGVEGRIVAIGFKPYWTSPIDSIIDKLEFNILDKRSGRIVPFCFNYMTGYKIIPSGNNCNRDTESVCLDILIYSPGKKRDEDSNDAIRIEISP